MKKIGISSSGNVIVEMTVEEFNALQSLVGGSKSNSNPMNPSPKVLEMPMDELVEYVTPRLLKLSPKKKDGVIKSITAMFQFSGGITDSKLELVYSRLLTNRVFQEKDGIIIYKNKA